MNFLTVPFDCSKLEDLKEFCNRCKNLNYKNNESLESMRLEWCLKNNGQFFLTYSENQLISISGCHPLPQIGNDTFRILFRGATLQEYQNPLGILNKYHMTAITFYSHVPFQIDWGVSKGYSKFCITTNWSNPDGIESMYHSHRVFKYLEKQKLVECVFEKINLYSTEQAVWKLNIDRYFEVRENFRKRHGLC